MAFHVPEENRITAGKIKSRREDGNNGAFLIHLNRKSAFVIASDGLGWEHVSVSFPDRMPTWKDMCEVKAIFWDKEDCVVQFHPPNSKYVDIHPFCLHLWRPVNGGIPTPETWMV
jgi:hypothetical protein